MVRETLSEKVRMLHFISTLSGITLKASPPWIEVIETTALSSGSTTRETMVWTAATMWLAATIGSRARWGNGGVAADSLDRED